MTLPERRDELEDFKTQIDLCDFACTWAGFTKDKKSSSRCSAVMRHTNGDKIIVARTPDRHHIYFNVHDGRDRGSIVDFVQMRERLSLGAVRKLLRQYLGRSITLPAGQEPTALSLVPSEFDVAAVQSKWLDAKPLPAYFAYLEHQRQIQRHVLDDPKFKDRIRIDARNNALFCHHSKDGLVGFEVKNRDFTGFAPGGLKGCWISRPEVEDRELVIFETAIDALSFASLRGAQGKRFVSTAGQMSPLQRDLLRLAVEKMPTGSRIVLAVDNDAGGDLMLRTITEALAPYSQQIDHQRPPERGQDWNDVLKAKSITASCSGPELSP